MVATLDDLVARTGLRRDEVVTREELDAIAPRNPLLLQASYHQSFVNSRAIELLGIQAPDGVIDEPDVRVGDRGTEARRRRRTGCRAAAGPWRTAPSPSARASSGCSARSA